MTIARIVARHAPVLALALVAGIALVAAQAQAAGSGDAPNAVPHAQALVAARVAQQGGEQLIDDFSTAQSPPHARKDAPAGNAASGAGILGGQRGLALRGEKEERPGVGYLRAVVSDGALQVGQKLGLSGSAILVYGGATGNDLGNLDLTSDGTQTALSLHVVFCDGPFDVVVRVYSDPNHWSEAHYSGAIVPRIDDTPEHEAKDVLLPFADLATGSGAIGPADLTRVRKVEVEFLGLRKGADLMVESLATSR